MWNQTSLAGKRVLVTAGADGIGLEITRAFAAAGAKVLVCDVQPESLDRLAKDLPDVHGCIADVSGEEAVASMFELVDQKLGGLDVLVNNAGVAGPTGGIETLSLADWERTWRSTSRVSFCAFGRPCRVCAKAATRRSSTWRQPPVISGCRDALPIPLPSGRSWALPRLSRSNSEATASGSTPSCRVPWMVLAFGRSLPPRPKRWANRWKK